MKKTCLVIVAVTLAALAAHGCRHYSPKGAAAPSSISNVCSNAALNELKLLVEQGNRDPIAEWAKRNSIPNINRMVQALTPDERRALANASISTQATGKEKENLIDAATQVLNSSLLGFYVEMFATAEIRVHEAPGGGYAAGDHISIGNGLLDGEKPQVLRNTLSHELFHIFNGRNHASVGISGLNEGTAIWIFKTAYPGFPKDEVKLGLAEPTFGTINFYRDIGIKGYPKCIPLGIPRTNITEKGRYVYEEILMKRDPSKLPVFDAAKMQRIYDKYYRDLNRNQDFSAWIDEFTARHRHMVAELEATGDCVLPPGFTNSMNSCPTPSPN